VSRSRSAGEGRREADKGKGGRAGDIVSHAGRRSRCGSRIESRASGSRILRMRMRMRMRIRGRGRGRRRERSGRSRQSKARCLCATASSPCYSMRSYALALLFRIAPLVMSTRKRIPVQMTFEDRRKLTRAGRTKNRPGPKPAAFANVRHRARAVHKYWNPLHVTMRAERGLPSFRAETLFAAFERAVRRTRRDDFRVVEFSVQDDHLHLIVEAHDNDALARGMKSFSVRANRLFNTALGRGAVACGAIATTVVISRAHARCAMRSSIASKITRSTSASPAGRRASIPAHRRDGFKAGPRFASTTTVHVRQKKRAPRSYAPRGRSTASSIPVKHHARQTEDAAQRRSHPAQVWTPLVSASGRIREPKARLSMREPRAKADLQGSRHRLRAPPFHCRPLVVLGPQIEIGARPGAPGSAPGRRDVTTRYTTRSTTPKQDTRASLSRTCRG
jgi:REP element-mobilizing transposase RayT